MGKSARLVKLSNILPWGRGTAGSSVAALAQELGVSRRTVYRYLDDLCESGLPVGRDERGYFLAGAAPHAASLTCVEVSALAEAVTAACQAGLASDPAAAEVALSKVLAAQRDVSTAWQARDLISGIHVQRLVTSAPRDRLGRDVRLLLDAVRQHRCVRAIYASPHSPTHQPRQIDPYHVAFRGRAHYLVGFCHLRKEVRTFRIDRFAELRLLAEQFEPPEDFDIDEYFARAWDLVTGRQTREVAVRFTPDMAAVVGGHRYHPSQRERREPDGSLVVTFVLGDLREVARWVLSFGASVQVLAPRELCEIVAEAARQTAALYA